MNELYVILTHEGKLDCISKYCIESTVDISIITTNILDNFPFYLFMNIDLNTEIYSMVEILTEKGLNITSRKLKSTNGKCYMISISTDLYDAPYFTGVDYEVLKSRVRTCKFNSDIPKIKYKSDKPTTYFSELKESLEIRIQAHLQEVEEKKIAEEKAKLYKEEQERKQRELKEEQERKQRDPREEQEREREHYTGHQEESEYERGIAESRRLEREREWQRTLEQSRESERFFNECLANKRRDDNFRHGNDLFPDDDVRSW